MEASKVFRTRLHRVMYTVRTNVYTVTSTGKVTCTRANARRQGGLTRTFPNNCTSLGFRVQGLGFRVKYRWGVEGILSNGSRTARKPQFRNCEDVRNMRVAETRGPRTLRKKRHDRNRKRFDVVFTRIGARTRVASLEKSD